MATQATSKLPIVDDIPSVTKLWNGRFRLEFFCKPSDKKIGWYKENIDKWLPAFGALQDDALENGWEYPANQDVSYDDMRLVEASVPYVPSAGEHFIRLVYETLTSSLVAEVDDKIIEGDNGLQITERTLIAKAGVEFTEEVGTGAYDGKTLIQSEVENTDAYTRVTARYSESGVISRSTDLVGSQQALVITSLGETPATPSGYSLAKTDVNNEEGFETTSYTFYENDSILSRSNDYVGSQLAEAIEVFNPSVEPTPTNAGAVLGNKSESNVDGIPTTRYTFLVPSVLSQSEDYVGSQLAIIVEAFNETPSTPAGYVLAKSDESDIEGIPTKRYTFLKDDVQLSESTDLVGSQLALVEEWFNPTSRDTKASYSLAKSDQSDVEGIPTVRYTFLKPSVLSRSEDKVGSQKAITIEAFNEIPSTPSGYDLANTQESDLEGIPTKRYTFLKPSVLSRSEDKVGSQLAITIEAFNEVPATPTDYVIANEQESDVEGIPTKRYTFLKPSVLSQTEDKVGSQLAIVIEAFSETPSTPSGYELASKQESDYEGIKTSRYTFLKPSVLSRTKDKVGSQLAIIVEAFGETPATPSGYSLANTQVSNVEGIATNRYTFLEPSILRVQTALVGGQQTVSVSAFSLDETAVAAAVEEVTENHLLISSSIDDVDGIPTSTFTYEVNSFEVDTTTERGLLVTSLVELSASIIASGEVGVTTRGGLYLTSEQIDNGGSIKRRETEWSEAGILSRSTNNLSEGAQEVTTVFLVAEIPDEIIGPVVRKSTQNVDGLKTISVSTLQDGSGGSIIGAGTNTVAEYQQLYPFTYPGIVSLVERDLIGTGNTYSFTARDFELEPPVEAKITATTIVRFSSKNLVDSQYEIWSPSKWAKGYARGIGWGYSPFAIDKGFRGYRVEEDTVLAGVEDGIEDDEWSMVLGNRIYNQTPWEIGISGGPIDPTGSTFTLDYKITQAFQDIDGVPYYRHVMTYARIPQQS